MPLSEYRRKRHFGRTPEPSDKPLSHKGKPTFVIQEHHARRLHWDLRLEDQGVLKSWAVTRQPTLDPSVKHLAIHVEDHPLAYGKFHGEIPKGEYGAGEVEIWDKGTFKNLGPRSVTDSIERGKVDFELHGKKLKGAYVLTRMSGEGGKIWLLIKKHDRYAREGDVAEIEQSKDAPETIEFTEVKKILFPKERITKADVLDYYLHIADWMLPYLKDRPVLNLPGKFPDWIPHVELNGRKLPVIQDAKSLMYFVNAGAVSFEIYTARVTSLSRPDFAVREAKTAAEAMKIRKQIKGKSHVKTGPRGFEVLAKAKEGEEATAVLAPYSLYSNKSALVSMPIEWDELKKKSFAMKDVLDRLKERGDPMREVIE